MLIFQQTTVYQHNKIIKYNIKYYLYLCIKIVGRFVAFPLGMEESPGNAEHHIS